MDIDSVLRTTLDDHRLSRTERRALRALLDEQQPDQRELALLRSRAFEIARAEVISPGAAEVLTWLEEVVKALQPPPSTPSPVAKAVFSPGDDVPAMIIRLLDRAGRTADICVFTITDNRISHAIARAFHRGVRVRIVTDDDKSADLGSDIDDLKRQGVQVRTDHSPWHMHHKFALLDDSVLLTGSYNWTRGAADHNQENLVVTYDNRLIRSFSATFDKLWNEFA